MQMQQQPSSAQLSTPRRQRLSYLQETRIKSSSTSTLAQSSTAGYVSPPPAVALTSAIIKQSAVDGTPCRRPNKSPSDVALPTFIHSASLDSCAAAAPSKLSWFEPDASDEPQHCGRMSPGGTRSSGATPLTENSWRTPQRNRSRPPAMVVSRREAASIQPCCSPSPRDRSGLTSLRNSGEARLSHVPRLPHHFDGVEALANVTVLPPFLSEGLLRPLQQPEEAGHFVPAGAEGILLPPTVLLSPSELSSSSVAATSLSPSSFDQSIAGGRTVATSRPPAADAPDRRTEDDETETLKCQLRVCRREQAKQALFLADLRTFVNRNHLEKQSVSLSQNPVTLMRQKIQLLWLVLVALPAKMAVRLVTTLVLRAVCATKSLRLPA